MFRRCVKVFRKRYSQYVRWNILCFWILGFWMALCTSDMYRLNWNRERNTSLEYATKMETMESFHYIILSNNDLWNIVLKSDEVIGFVQACTFLSFVVIIACAHKHVRKRVDRVYEVYLPGEKKRTRKDDVSVLKSGEDDHQEMKQFVEQYVNSEFEELTLGGNSQSVLDAERVADRILSKTNFCAHDTALLNEYKLHDDTNDEEPENQEPPIQCAMLQTRNENEIDFSHDDSKTQNDASINVTSSNEVKETMKCTELLSSDDKINYSTVCGYDMKTRIISSSPEFQKFLWNLKGARFSSQHTLGVYKI